MGRELFNYVALPDMKTYYKTRNKMAWYWDRNSVVNRVV